MKHKHIKILLITLIFTLNFINQPAPLKADNIGISSSPIIINDALKGMIYLHTITIHNQNTEESNITLEKNGMITEWITFRDYNDNSVTFDTIKIQGESTKKIIVHIQVPENTSNQKYNSEIIFKEQIEHTEKNQSATVQWQYPLQVTVNVTGEQNLNITIDNLYIATNEVNHPVKSIIKIINTGNVIAEPKIQVRITKNNVPVTQLSDTTKKIFPGSYHKYELVWNTDGMVPGQYTAYMTISLAGKMIRNQTIPFEVYKVGTLRREGLLDNIVLGGDLKVNETIRITAQFLNTGEIEVQAQLNSDIYIDDQFITTINSANITVQKGHLDTFHVNYLLPQKGDYSIKNYFVYDNIIGTQCTNTSILSFSLGNEKSSTLSPFLFITLSILFGIIASVLIVYRKKILSKSKIKQ